MPLMLENGAFMDDGLLKIPDIKSEVPLMSNETFHNQPSI